MSNPMVDTDLVYVDNRGVMGDARGLIVARVGDLPGVEQQKQAGLYHWVYKRAIKLAKPHPVKNQIVDEPVVLDGREWAARMDRNISTLLGQNERPKPKPAAPKRARKLFSGRLGKNV